MCLTCLVPQICSAQTNWSPAITSEKSNKENHVEDNERQLLSAKNALVNIGNFPAINLFREANRVFFLLLLELNLARSVALSAVSFIRDLRHYPAYLIHSFSGVSNLYKFSVLENCYHVTLCTVPFWIASRMRQIFFYVYVIAFWSQRSFPIEQSNVLHTIHGEPRHFDHFPNSEQWPAGRFNYRKVAGNLQLKKLWESNQ